MIVIMQELTRHEGARRASFIGTTFQATSKLPQFGTASCLMIRMPSVMALVDNSHGYQAERRRV
jgi:hypothetical protein